MNIKHPPKLRYFFLYSLLYCITPAYSQIIISEYVEGTGRNQCIEIFNYTDEDILLTGNYSLEFYFNGSSDPIFNRLEGTIVSMGTHIICTASNGAIGDENLGTSFNGNDAFAITLNGGIVDVFGSIGCDPGEGWPVAGGSTKDVTLRRKPCVNRGVSSSGGCGFPNSNEWEAFPVNTTNGLGSHDFGLAAKVEIMGNDALCENPSITLTATEGFESYQWSNGSTDRTTTVNAPGTYSVTVRTDKGCMDTDAKQINGQSPEIFATVSDIQDVSCRPQKDGSLTVTPSGGSGGFSYAWETGTGVSNVITGLGAGSYNITVSDQNGCTVTVPAEVGGDITVPLTFSAVGETCTDRKDGMITLSAQGGNLEYSIDDINYSSQTTFTGLSPGEYPVTVRNENGCGDEGRAVITGGTQFHLRKSIITQAKCQGEGGGQVILRPEGGKSPYSVSFDGAPFVNQLVFSDLKGDTFDIVIRDGSGCEKAFEQEIEPGSDLVLEDFKVTPATCVGLNDGGVTIETSGGGGAVAYFFTAADGTDVSRPYFQPTFTDLAVGNYHMLVRDSEFDCRLPLAFEITEKEPLVTNATNAAICNSNEKGAITILPQSGEAPYQYSIDSGVFINSNVFTDLAPDTYVVTTKDSRGCTKVDSVSINTVADFEIAFVSPRPETCVGNEDGQITVVTNSINPVEYSLDGINFIGSNILSGLPPNDYIVYAQAKGCQDTATATILPAKQIGLNGIIPKVSLCEGAADGQLTVMVSGGLPPYSYQLDEKPFQTENIFTNLVAGIYDITVRDANLCEQTFADIILAGPTRLDAECEVVQNVTTFDGTDGQVEITIFGGASPYDVQLVNAGFNNVISLDGSAAFSNLPVGEYEVEIVDNNNCSTTCFFTITQPICGVSQDTLYENQFTCDPANVGTFEIEERGIDGCTDMIFRTFLLAPKDTTDLQATTCNPSEVGVTPTLLINQFGCDSLIRTTYKLLRSDTTFLTQTSCQSEEVGMSSIVLINAVNCDSTLMIETVLDATIVQTNLTEVTCNPTEQGVDTLFEKTLAGCDSLIITRTISNASPPTELAATTCDTANVRIDTFSLLNQFACDSLIIVHTTLAETHFLSLNRTTCQVQDTGLVTQILINQFGCDSIINTQISLAATDDCLLDFTVSTDTVCWNDISGSIALEVTAGNPPFDYFILNDFFGDTLQKGIITTLNQQFDNIPVGQYALFLVNNRNISQRAKIEIAQNDEINIQGIISDYHGFAISCAGERDGSINLAVNGGKGPYTFQWETGEQTADLQNLASGQYAVTVVDANNCSSKATFDLIATNDLSIDYQAFSPRCFGDAVGKITIFDVPNAGGTVEYSLDGTFFQPIPQLPFTIEKLAPAEYQLFIQDENDCQASADIHIPMPNENQLSLGQDQHLVLGDSLTIIPHANFVIERFAWSANVPLTCPDCLDIKTVPTKAGQYSLTAFDSNDCSVTTSVKVNLKKDKAVYLPNVFSPNADGLNDRYQIFPNNSVTRLNNFRIYDYEGRLMYQIYDRTPNDSTVGWDGTFNGQKMLPAVFVVLVEVELLDGTTKTYSQTMTLVK